jgi:hypothetical protein
VDLGKRMASSRSDAVFPTDEVSLNIDNCSRVEV